jgi:hypothetical protein
MFIADGKVSFERLRHVDVVVGMDRTLAAERSARQLAAAVRDDLVHVHVELDTCSGKHVVVFTGEDFVTNAGD